MAKRFNKTAFWWLMVGMTILVGIGYSGVVALNWDRMVSLGANSQPKEYTEKDLLQCEPGTHQEHGRCVSNPVRPGAAAPSAKPAPAKK